MTTASGEAASAGATSQFDGLLADIGAIQAGAVDMNKALNDGKVAAAAADGEGEGEGKDEGEGEGEGEGADDAPMLKGFTFTDENGQEQQGVDATQMVKALTGMIETADSRNAQLFTGVIAALKAQGEMLKSFSAKLDSFGNKGQGRRAVLTAAGAAAGAEAATGAVGGAVGGEMNKALGGLSNLDVDSFFEKSLAAQANGKLPLDFVAIAEIHLGNSGQIPADMVRQALSAIG